MSLRLFPIIGVVALASCAGSPEPFEVPTAFTVSSPAVEYRIGSLDLLDITVFQVEDLSFKEVRVNAAGNLQLPLVGTLQARGLTAEELSRQISTILSQRYVRNPQVSVVVREAASQKVTVDGAVTEPGVFEMRGNTTLLQAVAMAKGPSRTAALDEVVVFRTIDGQRMAARFDLADIRRGSSPDPVLLGDDIVVVGGSFRNTAFREIIAALPAVAAFVAYGL